MKTNELQLGDYVKCSGKGIPMVVVGIYSDVAYLDFEDNEGDMWEVDEEDIRPIPISKEILEKNGFKYLCIPSDGTIPEEESYIYENEEKTISIKVVFPKKRPIWKIYMQKFWDAYEFANSFVGYIQYVHELQHALRLCNIDKEIVL